jgi:hypothetical protein
MEYDMDSVSGSIEPLEDHPLAAPIHSQKRSRNPALDDVPKSPEFDHSLRGPESPGDAHRKKLKQNHEKTANSTIAWESNDDVFNAYKSLKEVHEANSSVAEVSSIPSEPREVVDLTMEDSDAAISSSSKTEPSLKESKPSLVVKFEAIVMANRSPLPLCHSWNTSNKAVGVVPSMSVDIQPIHHGNIRYQVSDPQHRPIGMVDMTAGRAIRRLLNISSSVSVKCRLPRRPLFPNEQYGAIYSIGGQAITQKIRMEISVWAPNELSEPIITTLKNHKVSIRGEVSNILNRTSISNALVSTDQAESFPTENLSEDRLGSQLLDTFQTLDLEMPEMEQSSSVTTPLLKHQRQALYFMTQREKAVQAEKKLDLWDIIQTDNGPMYLNLVDDSIVPNKPHPVLGGLLADDMGLGKTLTNLSHIVGTKEQAIAFSALVPDKSNGLNPKLHVKGTLVVVPPSVLGQWITQVEDHIQSDALKVHKWHGTKRALNIRDMREFDLVFTTYGTLAAEHKKWLGQRHASPLFGINWWRVVLDEAHEIRTYQTLNHRAACQLTAVNRWAASGTPIQNKLEDFGALLKFLRVFPFNTREQFAFRIIDQFKAGNAEFLPRFAHLVQALTIRRLKTSLPDLPEKVSQTVFLPMTEHERRLYSVFFQHTKVLSRRYQSQCKKKEATGNQYRRFITALIKLRQVCCHVRPSLPKRRWKFADQTNRKKKCSSLQISNSLKGAMPIAPSSLTTKRTRTAG